jgi:hypothetical protein
MTTYSPLVEAQRIFDYLCKNCDQLGLPVRIQELRDSVRFVSDYNRVYFPIPFKEMETAAALKAVEGSVAGLLADLRFGKRERAISVNLESVANFLLLAYLATIDGIDKLDPAVKTKLKGRSYILNMYNQVGLVSVVFRLNSWHPLPYHTVFKFKYLYYLLIKSFQTQNHSSRVKIGP